MGLRALTDGCMLFMVVRVCQGAVDCIGVGRKRDPYIISDQIQLIEYSPERVPSVDIGYRGLLIGSNPDHRPAQIQHFNFFCIVPAETPQNLNLNEYIQICELRTVGIPLSTELYLIFLCTFVSTIAKYTSLSFSINNFPRGIKVGSALSQCWHHSNRNTNSSWFRTYQR